MYFFVLSSWVVRAGERQKRKFRSEIAGSCGGGGCCCCTGWKTDRMRPRLARCPPSTARADPESPRVSMAVINSARMRYSRTLRCEQRRLRLRMTDEQLRTQLQDVAASFRRTSISEYTVKKTESNNQIELRHPLFEPKLDRCR